MSAKIAIRRKNMLNLLREAAKLGPYDEFPMMQPEVDPQLHLSRNDRAQPFFLICEKDCVLTQYAGRGKVAFRDSSVNWFDLEPGDFVYIPGGTPHRIFPDGETIDYRYKARDAGLEAVAWYCESCGSELHREVWDTRERLPQEGYQLACERFNGTRELRVCKKCGTEHPALDLAPYRWAAVARALRDDSVAAAEPQTRPAPGK